MESFENQKMEGGPENGGIKIEGGKINISNNTLLENLITRMDVATGNEEASLIEIFIKKIKNSNFKYKIGEIPLEDILGILFGINGFVDKKEEIETEYNMDIMDLFERGDLVLRENGHAVEIRPGAKIIAEPKEECQKTTLCF